MKCEYDQLSVALDISHVDKLVKYDEL